MNFITKSAIIYFVLIIILSSAAAAETDFYSRNYFLKAPASVYDDGLLGFGNPANLAMLKNGDLRFYWSSDGPNAGSFRDWGVFSGARHIGFGVQHQEAGDFKVTDFNLSLGFGSQANAFGIGYSWSTGDSKEFGREKMLTASSLMRPFPYISFSLMGKLSTESDWSEGAAELGIRPLGTSRLTLFADAAIDKGMDIADMPWSTGAVVEVADGISLVARYFDNESFTVGLNICFGRSGVGGQAHFDKDQNNSGYTYSVRIGGMRPSIFPTMLEKDKYFLPVQIRGRIDYQNYVLFDKSIRFFDLLSNLKAAVDDERVGVVAVNLSGMRIYPEMAWELREALKEVRKAGKKVFVFIDTPGMTSYHLASAADKIILDPEGMILMPGIMSGRTYLKGMMDKLGIGFDEWRFYKYKSMAERFSRESYSEADKEQAQDYVDDRYELVRADICADRGLSPDTFDWIIDDSPVMLAQASIEAGLVDTLARWSDVDRVIYNFTHKGYRGIKADNLLANALPQTVWGEKPKVVIVYGLGECAMDSGIRARWLEQVFLHLARDGSVAAVVFRVDSPGGNGMASDLVAEALKKCAKVKPVIISQGQIAASGGYWLSMYGDKILAGPNSVTGSIGVIGGWVYDKGFGDKIGMSSDHVYRGKHADVNAGIRIPYINQTLPSRNLTNEEKDIIKKLFDEMYDSFVTKVAAGRNLPVDSVRTIAEGHSYSGVKGLEIGLVDEIGGLMTAVSIAMNEAGIEKWDDVDLVELPKTKGWFNLRSKIMPFGWGIEKEVETDSDALEVFINMLLDNRLQPLPMLAPGTYPEFEE